MLLDSTSNIVVRDITELLARSTPEIKLTLKDITESLCVNHHEAMNTVAEMAKEPEFGKTSILDISYDGDTFQTYQLDKRQSIAVALQLNTRLLMRTIDRYNATMEIPI